MPPAERLDAETSRFLDWLNGASSEPPLLKAGLGHLWFVTLHPFDDGNGRIARVTAERRAEALRQQAQRMVPGLRLEQQRSVPVTPLDY